MKRFLALALLLPLAAAVPSGEPNLTDPAGDAVLLEVPAPAGLEAWDVVAAWFHDETPEEVTLTIQVVQAAEPPPSGEVGVTFLTPDGPRIAGFTVIPGVYGGGFLCTSDEAGDVRAADGNGCEGVPATFTDDAVVVRLSRAALNATRSGDVLAGPWGWSESYASNGERYRIDRTDVGRDHVFATGASDAPANAPGALRGPTKEAAGPAAVPCLAAVAVAFLARRGG